MDDAKKMKVLKILLVVFGIVFVIGIYPLSLFWPSGWQWHGGQGNYYFQMILGVYATLGVFMVLAAKDPMKHLSLIWFVVWSSVVHSAIMAIQAFGDDMETGHLVGDVPVLLLVAILLALLTPRRLSA